MNKNILGLYPHNIESYKKVKEAYQKGEKVVGILHATGTGKTFNALQLALDNKDKQIIYVTPYNSIIEHIHELIKENPELDYERDFKHVKFMTYAGLAKLSPEELEELNVDMMILDEFHHIGAPVWGEAVNKVIDSHKDLLIFGMSAYSVRDRGTQYERDMAEDNGTELFSDKIVSRYDLVDAILDGVLPVPIYKSAYINLLDYVKRLEDKATKKYKGTPKLTEYLKVYNKPGVFKAEIDFYGTTYTLATGGIHSVDPPRILKSNEKYIIRHHDYTSYYPSIMISYNIAPKHLHQKSFIKMMSFLKDTRVKAKHGNNGVNVIDNVPNKITAEVLKIVINAIYGKLGSDLFFLYDRFAQMQVTINGQLMTMTLIEELELNGIHVVSANTDGIIIKLPRNKEDVYKDITNRWNEFNKMGADYEDYDMFVGRDVNNYFDVQFNSKKNKEIIEYKGALDPKQYLNDFKKGYDMPIIAIAVYNYFKYNKPVMDTLREHKDILDFCKTQNVGRQFEVVYQQLTKDGILEKIYSQRHVRFYVSTKGVVIQKEHVVTNKCSNLASGLPVKILNTLDDLPIEERDINYKYYYDEAYKIIDPIQLSISPNQKGNTQRGTVSGKVLLKQYSQQYLTLFDDE